MPALEDNFAQIVSDHTAGDPMRDDVVWTYLSSTEISQRLDKLGTPICPDTVQTLLDAFDFHKRQAEKTKAMGYTPERNQQFEIIAGLKERYFASPNPIISMDSKKRSCWASFFVVDNGTPTALTQLLTTTSQATPRERSFLTACTI